MDITHATPIKTMLKTELCSKNNLLLSQMDVRLEDIGEIIVQFKLRLGKVVRKEELELSKNTVLFISTRKQTSGTETLVRAS